MLFYFLRHGNPIYDPDSLTALGERQAEALARRLAVHGLDKIYVSSSTRAQLTAKPTCEILQKKAEVLDWTNEHYAWMQLAPAGEDGRKTWAFQSPKYSSYFCLNEVRVLGREWHTHPLFADTEFTAGITRVQTHADEFLASLGFEHDLDKNMYRVTRPNAERVALFAHQGFGLAFLSCVLDIPYPMFATHADMQHSGMSVLWFDEKKEWVCPKLLQLSNDSHLFMSGLSTRYGSEDYLI